MKKILMDTSKWANFAFANSSMDFKGNDSNFLDSILLEQIEMSPTQKNILFVDSKSEMPIYTLVHDYCAFPFAVRGMNMWNISPHETHFDRWA